MKVCTKDYKLAIPVGIGGMGCSCCMPRKNVKDSRVAINRAFRRKDKLNITKEIRNEDIPE